MHDGTNHIQRVVIAPDLITFVEQALESVNNGEASLQEAGVQSS